ncbi:ribonuclease III [Oryzomicrobium terrae]|uniref:Ribonuclease 3 n=1 Tax=Oryzomicrobium terrae TaxID=1735038 RepID=A0A5C1E844_9RHOO|nr:ribonuclease III [Oryzomicrobium terrae]
MAGSLGLAPLQRSLGHTFTDQGLLQAALTHRSYGTPHNERLEFIGDGLLNSIVALQLYQRFPHLPEGDLSRLRANLVRQDTLHQLALKLDLGRYLLLGEGELKSGGHQRPSILADALEALFGATYLDAGFEAVVGVVTTLFAPLIAAIDPAKPMKDPKTRLQEWLQARRKPLPTYVMSGTEGDAHVQEFIVACEIQACNLTTQGRGTSRRAAEQQAAEAALRALEK